MIRYDDKNIIIEKGPMLNAFTGFQNHQQEAITVLN
jgi:hypothetical protein